MNKCLQCGEETNNPKFCSSSCAAKYNNKKRKKPFTKCVNCGEDIGRNGYRDSKKKFCSNNCQGDYIKKETIQRLSIKEDNGILTGKCKTHGTTRFYKIKNRASVYYRCGKCNANHVNDRRKKLKLMAIEYMGGKCCKCGYNKNVRSMQFHHLDPNEKDFGISKNTNARSWEEIKKELDKCILVCANCHGELEDEIEINKSYSCGVMVSPQPS